MKTKKQKTLKPYRRLLHINNEVWTYEITRKSVCICSPDLKSRAFPNYADITGMSPNDVERGNWKRWLHITPALVKDYIISNFSDWESIPIQTIWRNAQKKKREDSIRIWNSKKLVEALKNIEGENAN